MPRQTFNEGATLSFERMAGETAKAFSAFRVYRDLGKDRTIENVRLSIGKPAGYARQLQYWSSDYEWVERARMWDNHLDSTGRKEAERSVAIWEQRRQESLEGNMQLASRLRARVAEMLEYPITKEVVKDFGGKTTTYIIPAQWTFSSIANMVKTIAELEAQTIGEGLAGGDDADFDVESATVEELREFVNRHTGKGKAPT